MRASLIASTKVDEAAIDDAVGGFKRDSGATDAEHLIETAGRTCYQSFDRPNPSTRRAKDYIQSAAIEKGHGSILEHASATFLITGVSRSLTHEFIRHRHLSYSELSQRYVDMSEADHVVPPAFRDSDGGARLQVEDSVEDAQAGYRALLLHAEDVGLTGKRARQAARAVMPECTETKIVVTGNLRAWRHFVITRGSEHADDEIRELAIELLDQLYVEAPGVFGDLPVVTLADGRQVVEG